MIKRPHPTLAQANIAYFITALMILIGSTFFIPVVGFGTNAWINELIYILLPPLVLAGINRWDLENVFRFRASTGKNKAISFFAGMLIWFFGAYIAKWIALLLDNTVGTLKIDPFNGMSFNQQILMLIAMVILAPICEEILFRGLIQKAYEIHTQKYGFVIAALLFGLFHIMNGISEVAPAFIIGLVLGYFVYRTGSIANSMLAHGGNNLSAILFGRFIASEIPLWLNFAGIGALIAVVFLLKTLKKEEQETGNGDEITAEKRPSILATILFLFSIGLLLFVGIMELWARTGKA